MLRILAVASIACASGLRVAQTPVRPVLDKTLALRGGGQLGSIDEKACLLIQAAGTAAFGTEFILSKWASTRYWDDDKPTAGWKQLSEAFGIGLLTLAYQTYNIATNESGAANSYGKINTIAWAAWTLMHVKWQQEGSLISSGPYHGQVGGGIPCALIAALSIYTFYM